MYESENTAADRTDALIRGLFVLLFYLVARVAFLVVGAIAIAQFLHTLVAREPNDRVRDFGKDLSRYIAEIVEFLSYETDRKPWPFAPWPTASLAPSEFEERR